MQSRVAVQLIRSVAFLSKRGWLLILLLLPFIPLKAQQEIPVASRIQMGEKIKYDLYFKWGLLMPRAGEAVLNIDNYKNSGKDEVYYNLHFKTVGLFEKVYRMRDTLDCFFTPDMLLLRSEKRSDEGDYYSVDKLDFSYANDSIYAHSLRYTPKRVKIDTMLVSAREKMYDMMAGTLYLRSLSWDNISMGDEFPFTVAIGRDMVNISFRYTGQQIVERGKMKYSTRHFYIDIFDEAFTQSKAAAEIWIGDDENHIPVKIRAKLKIGAAEVYLKDVEGLRHKLTSRFVMPGR